jgi:hypothetical protein
MAEKLLKNRYLIEDVDRTSLAQVPLAVPIWLRTLGISAL